jgi:hypothetical protein
LFVIVVVALLLPAWDAFAQSAVQRGGGFQKGISYAAWWSGEYSTPEADVSLKTLSTTGANWISLVVTRYQDTFTSTTINPPGVETPTDQDLEHVIKHAHSLGLKVMLKPHLDLPNERADGIWRGYIGSGFTTEQEWSTWFASYRGFIETYAALAQAYGADQLCVGTELLGTTQREAEWRAVIAGVRARYSGPLVYAALHGGEETRIAWWDAVDYIGIDAYYPVNHDVSIHPTVEDLEAGWETPKVVMADLSARNGGKPVLLTEIGYRSQHGCGSHPSDSVGVSPVDLEEQANAYEAAFRQLYSEPWLGGIFWWSWSPDRFDSGPCDDSYMPYRKPAERVLRAWYGGQAIPGQPLLLPDEDRVMDVYADGLSAGWSDWSWNATVSTSASDPVYAGTRSMSVTLQPWGAVSLSHAAFDAQPYTWLEFYVRGGSAIEPELAVFFHAADGANGTALPSVPVNDCEYIAGGTIDSGTWKRVLIPLHELNGSGLGLVRLNIQNKDPQNTTQFWIDELRLVGAKEPTAKVMLPLVISRHP